MKFFLIAVTGAFLWYKPHALFAADQMTASPKKDWTEIVKDKDVMIEQPSYADNMGPKGVFNTCYTENEFRSIEPVEVCAEFESTEINPAGTEMGPNYDFYCEKKMSKQIVISRSVERSICEQTPRLQKEAENAKCLKAKFQDQLPTTLRMEVVRATGEAKGQSLFTKNYQIPKC